MPRVYVPPDAVKGDAATLPEPEAKRLLRVLRLGPGDPVTLFDGTREYDSTITSLNAKAVNLKILAYKEKKTEPKIRVTLGQGMPKGEKLEWALQKAVELGVARFVPVVAGRSVKRPDEKGEEKNVARLRKIATEAGRQSGRVSLPDVPGYVDLAAFLEMTKDAGLKIMPYEGEKTKGLKQLLKGAFSEREIAILVGPEGGFTEDEVRAAAAAGYVTVTLGPRILRTETAGIAALAVIQYELGDAG